SVTVTGVAPGKQGFVSPPARPPPHGHHVCGTRPRALRPPRARCRESPSGIRVANGTGYCFTFDPPPRGRARLPENPGEVGRVRLADLVRGDRVGAERAAVRAGGPDGPGDLRGRGDRLARGGPVAAADRGGRGRGRGRRPAGG